MKIIKIINQGFSGKLSNLNQAKNLSKVVKPTRYHIEVT